MYDPSRTDAFKLKVAAKSMKFSGGHDIDLWRSFGWIHLSLQPQKDSADLQKAVCFARGLYRFAWSVFLSIQLYI